MTLNSAGSDLLTVVGTVNLGGGLLDLVLNPVGVAEGTQFRLIANDGGVASNPVIGEFANKPQNTLFVEDGYSYTIDYRGGDGNDVVQKFQGVPEPSSISLVVLAC